MKLEKIDRATCRLLREDLNLALKPFAKGQGLDVNVGSATFTPDLVTFKVTLSIVGAEPVTVQHYKVRQNMDNLPPLGTLIQIKNNMYTIVGLKWKARKNNILIERADGKQFVTSVDVVNNANTKKLGKSPYVTGRGANFTPERGKK